MFAFQLFVSLSLSLSLSLFLSLFVSRVLIWFLFFFLYRQIRRERMKERKKERKKEKWKKIFIWLRPSFSPTKVTGEKLFLFSLARKIPFLFVYSLLIFFSASVFTFQASLSLFFLSSPSLLLLLLLLLLVRLFFPSFWFPLCRLVRVWKRILPPFVWLHPYQLLHGVITSEFN